MPKVGKKHFPYTKEGGAAAMKDAKAQRGAKEAWQAHQLGRGAHPGMYGQRRKGEHAAWEEAKRRREGLPGSGYRPPRRPPVRVGKTPPKPPRKNPYQESDR